ncbi:25449_t:CDS:2, partial [Dentiscutata erythropus]
MSSCDENSSTSISTNKDKQIFKNIGGRPEGPVWSYFTKGKKVGKGKYEATCDLCGAIWNHGELIELENHLANHCPKADSTIIPLKKTNLSYEPPSRQYLSGQLLEQQLAIINQKTDKIFYQYSNLTL